MAKAMQNKKENLTASLVTDHVVKEAQDKAATIGRELAFDHPAIIVNNFQLAVAPNYARLAGIELSHGGKPNVRAVLAFDYATLGQLYSVLGRFLQHLEQKVAAENAAAQNKSAANGDITLGEVMLSEEEVLKDATEVTDPAQGK